MSTENTYLVSGGAAGFLVGILLYPFLFGGQMPGHHTASGDEYRSAFH